MTGVDADLATLHDLLLTPPGRVGVTQGQDAYEALARVEAALSRLREQRDAWMDPFDGSGVEWHEGLPNPYTYQASDFSKLVSAVHEYECRAEAAEAEAARLREERNAARRCDSSMQRTLAKVCRNAERIETDLRAAEHFLKEACEQQKAELSRLREQRDALRAKLTTPLDAPTEYDLTGREGE